MPPWHRYLRRLTARLRPSSGRLEVIPGVQSPELGNRRDLLVFLPSSYRSGLRRYPVVYMQDGQNLFDPRTSFAGDWGLGPILAGVGREGYEAIVVGIPNMGTERIAEYSPFPDAKIGGGRGGRYLDFLLHTVKPLIDARYRTRPERVATGIAGSSMGGLISLYAFFRRAEAFGFVAGLSPSLWFAEAAIFPAVETAPFVPGKIYLDIGTLEGPDPVSGVVRLRDLLLAKGYRRGRDLLWVEELGGRHNEAAWGRRFGQALPFLLGDHGGT